MKPSKKLGNLSRMLHKLVIIFAEHVATICAYIKQNHCGLSTSFLTLEEDAAVCVA